MVAKKVLALAVLALVIPQPQQIYALAPAPCDYSIIQQGGLFIQHNWINAEQIAALRQDIVHLRSLSSKDAVFFPSGLSNRVSGDGNVFGKSDRLTCTITSSLVGGDCSIRGEMDAKLYGLLEEIAEQQSRQSISLEEQYYSISPASSLLPRHMDERHEETKGDKAWLSESRRSISWLVYLSDDSMTGGELRAFTRRCTGPNCGAHAGNVQVGWLDLGEGLYDPVFLDSFFKVRVDQQELPLCSLYRLANNSQHDDDEREYLSHPFGPDSPAWPDTVDLDPDKFGQALASQLFLQFQSSFVSTEEIHEHPIDVRPTAGTLVLFDSVAIPHEVLMVTSGERLALAGWFHEPQQDFPQWM